jgi:hypothetical protein
MLIGIFAIPVAASAAPANLNDDLSTEDGPTDILGGGDHFFVKFGTDAAFGVVWGTEETPNDIYFVAIKARYLGIAHVYDQDGNLVEGNRTVKIYTLYAVRLDDIVEFDDVNDNGTLAYHRLYQSGNFTGEYAALEPIYKMVDMKSAWTQSEVAYEETDESRRWAFDLAAYDLPYVYVNNTPAATDVGDNRLNSLTLTFHLEANMVKVDNATMAQWRVTVHRGTLGTWFMNAERLENIVMSGKIINYNIKWDQLIEGWDYDPSNENPALLMEIQALVGNVVPTGAATWMHMNMVRSMNEAGHVICNEGTSSELRLDENSGLLAQSKQLIKTRLTFGGDWTRIGRFEWVSNVTVDGETDLVHGQITAGVPIWALGTVEGRSVLFAGFGVLAGLTFPGGNVIDHDPTFASDALVIGEDGARIPVGLLVIGVGLAAVVIVTLLVLVTMEKKPGQKTRQSYERSTNGTQQVDWSKYYRK